MTPYCADDLVSLFLGDCREMTAWLEADVLVTDPPYGRQWRQGEIKSRGHDSERSAGIEGDIDTTARDTALTLWGGLPAVVFGDLMLAPPPGTKQVLPYRKAPDAGTRGATAGFRRDAEAAYLIGPWTSGLGGRTSFLVTANRCHGHMVKRYGHPHAKPVDVMEILISACPAGVIADPFAGSGSTLVAARNLGRKAVGVEIDERYCEKAARRLSQGVLEAVTA